jgi:hypothetical protein
MSEQQEYVDGMITRFWQYRENVFRGLRCPDCSAQRDPHRPLRPPVFCKIHQDRNVIIDPGASPANRASVLATLDKTRRHMWFGSMRSSQALAQSVFGNLQVSTKLHLLACLQSEEGLPAFFNVVPPGKDFALDRPMHHLRKYLGERIPTSVDLFVVESPVVAGECKLMEEEIGGCSRPNLPKKDEKYCDGRYVRPAGWTTRCSLAEKSNVRYWDYVPHLFPSWAANVDHDPCPLRVPYQLVRNVLAACLRSDGRLDRAAGHALLLYDNRNPAFRSNGAAAKAYESARTALVDPALLRRCSWQRLIGCLEQDPELRWLLAEIRAKYGLTGTGTDRSAP